MCTSYDKPFETFHRKGSPREIHSKKPNDEQGTSTPVAVQEYAKDALKFIDLFAGIGGIRLAFEQAGAKCIFSSEWDVNAQKTYEANFFEKPHGDITKIKPEDIPDFDILTGGFPCQPFSVIGRQEITVIRRLMGPNLRLLSKVNSITRFSCHQACRRYPNHIECLRQGCLLHRNFLWFLGESCYHKNICSYFHWGIPC